MYYENVLFHHLWVKTAGRGNDGETPWEVMQCGIHTANRRWLLERIGLLQT